MSKNGAGRRTRAGTWGALAALLPGGTAAALPPLPPTLDPITVTSRRIPEDLDAVPAAVGTVQRDDIQTGRQQLALDEALVRVPGLFVQNRTNFAQDLRISSRGFGARANFGVRGLKVYVDGIPATLPDGQAQIDSVDLGSTERIEVMRGPASSLYGAAAGGVIQIHSEDGPEEPFVEGRFTAGEFGFRRGQLKAGGQAGPLNHLVSLSHRDWGGYREQSASRSSLLNTKLRWDIDPSSDLSVVFNAVHSPRADDPGGLTRAEVRSDRRQASPANAAFDAGEELDQQRLGIAYRKSFGDRHTLTLRNYYLLRDFQNRLPFLDGGSVDLERLFLGGGLQYGYAGEVLGHAHRWVTGLDVDAQRDDRRRFDNLFGARGPLSFAQDEDVTATGAYLQSQVDLGRRVQLSAGARFDRVAFRVDDRFLADGDDSGSRTFDELSPSAGLLWSPLRAVNVYGNVSTSFETPTTTEFANPAGGGGLNPDLDAARSLNYELGVKGLLPGRLRYDVALFRVDVDDELVPFELPGQSGRSFFRNAGKSTREGLELGVAVEPLAGLRVSLAYTYSDFTYDRFATPAGVFDGSRIPGIPCNQLWAEVAWRHASGFFAAWEALWVDALFADDANSVRDGAYLVSNLRLGRLFRLGPLDVEPFAGVNNLFDRAYNDNVRINAFGGRFFEPAPDRNFYGGIRIRYHFPS